MRSIHMRSKHIKQVNYNDTVMSYREYLLLINGMQLAEASK